MISLIRTDSANEDFRSLVVLLDKELQVRDGEDHTFYSQFNKIDALHLLGVVVALADNVPVGCGAFKKHSDGVAEIKRMFVAEVHRGKRIAAQILAELETWALELGFIECVLETGFNQPEAIALYKRSGYDVIPNYGQYADVAKSVCMKRVIATDT